MGDGATAADSGSGDGLQLKKRFESYLLTIGVVPDNVPKVLGAFVVAKYATL